MFCTDDHAGFREALRELIAATPGFVHIGEASTGADTIARVPQLLPDLVLIDVHMPGMSGFEAAATLASGGRDLLIVLMSAGPIEVPSGLAARGGVLAIVAKQELSPSRLLDLWRGRATRSPGGNRGALE